MSSSLPISYAARVKRLFTSLSVVVLASWFAVVAVWIVSEFRALGFAVPAKAAVFRFDALHGKIIFTRIYVTGLTPNASVQTSRPHHRSDRVWSIPIRIRTKDGRGGLMLENSVGGDSFVTSGPLGVRCFANASSFGWPLLVLTVLLASVGFWTNRLRRAAQRGYYRSCGYDLRATPERCPECGTARMAE